jgi:hypothetical protein
VTDKIWEAAVAHVDETHLSAIVQNIAQTNFFNRINLTIPGRPGRPGEAHVPPIQRPLEPVG